MRKITGKASRNKTLILFINQVREKIGGYVPMQVTTGGLALGFYASIRLAVSRGELIEENKKVIGQQVKFRVAKSNFYLNSDLGLSY